MSLAVAPGRGPVPNNIPSRIRMVFVAAVLARRRPGKAGLVISGNLTCPLAAAYIDVGGMHYILGRIVVGFVVCLISFIAYSSQIFIIWPWYGSEWSVELLTVLVPFK